MADADQIRVNGNLYSWGSITIKVGNDRYFGFTEISYGDARERTKAHGLYNAGEPLGRTQGKYTADESTLVGYKHSIQILREALANGSEYGDTTFQVVVQYAEDGLDPEIVELNDCVIVKDSVSLSEGSDALMETIAIDPMSIRRNGLSLFKERR